MNWKKKRRNPSTLLFQTLKYRILAAARILYAKFWKDEVIPELYEWKAKVIYMSEMDKLTKKLRGGTKVDFKKEWDKWNQYCKSDSDFQRFDLFMDIS